MDWIIGLVLFVGGLILGGLVMAKRLETIEELLENQSKINQGQVEVNQTQIEINEHLADWIRAVEKMKK